MRHARFLPATLPAAALATALISAFALGRAVPAAAADNAMAPMRTADNLSAEQQAQVEAWVNRQMNQVRGGLSEDVSAGREALIGELRAPGVSPSFKSALGRAITGPAGELLKSSKVQVRLNTVIILAHVNNPDAALVLVPILKDPADGVRLWAARAIRSIIEPTSSERQTLGADREQTVVGAAQAQIAKEADGSVFRELAELLITVGSPKAHEALLGALDARIAAHAANADLGFDVELRSFNALYQKFLQTDEKGPVLLSLLGVAYRCEKLAMAQMAAEPNDKRLVDDRKAVVLAADKMVRAQYQKLNPGKPVPRDLNQLVPFPNKWPEAKGAILQWQELLKAPPLSIPDAKLK